MATAKQRSKKSGAAGSKAAHKTAPSTASTPGTKATAAKGKPTGKRGTQKAGKPARAAGPAKAAKPLRASAPKAATAGKAAKPATRAKAAPKARDGKAAGAARPAGMARKPARRAAGAKGASGRQSTGDATLFGSLTDGERAEALRLLTEDPRLAGMANVGRYRVIAVEALAVKAPAELSTHRLARAVIYDYSSERSVDASVDLDTGKVTHLKVARTQPMLSREEESAATAIALADEQVTSKLAPGDAPQVAMHYWSHSPTSLAHARRAAAVLFGQPTGATSLIAVVDLLDNLVCEIVPAAEW